MTNPQDKSAVEMPQEIWLNPKDKKYGHSDYKEISGVHGYDVRYVRAEPASDKPGGEVENQCPLCGHSDANESVLYGLQKWERVSVKELPHIQGTVKHCGKDGVSVRWDDGKIGDFDWRPIGLSSAHRLQTVRKDPSNAALTPQPSQNAEGADVEKDVWDRAAKLKADIFYFRQAYKYEWEDFDLQRFDRMEKCVDYLTKGKTND